MKPPLPPRAHRKVRTEEPMARMELWERPQIRQQKTAGDVQESTGVVDGLVNDVENAVDR